MCSSDLSRFDGWGMLVSEALAAGTPAICTDSCGVKALLVESPRSVAAASPRSLAAALSAAVEAGLSPQRLRTHIHAMIARENSAETAAERLVGMLRIPAA